MKRCEACGNSPAFAIEDEVDSICLCQICLDDVRACATRELARRETEAKQKANPH